MMVEFVQGCCCSPHAHLCLGISNAPRYWGAESSVMLLSSFYNEAIIPKSSFKTVSLWDPLHQFLKALVSVFERDPASTSHSLNLCPWWFVVSRAPGTVWVTVFKEARAFKRFSYLPLHFLTWSLKQNLYKLTTQKRIWGSCLKWYRIRPSKILTC